MRDLRATITDVSELAKRRIIGAGAVMILVVVAADIRRLSSHPAPFVFVSGVLVALTMAGLVWPSRARWASRGAAVALIPLGVVGLFSVGLAWLIAAVLLLRASDKKLLRQTS